MYRVDNMKVKCLKKVLPVSLRLNTSGLYYPDTIGQNCNFVYYNRYIEKFKPSFNCKSC